MDAGDWISWLAAVIALVALYFTWRQTQNAEKQTELQRQIAEDAAQPYVWLDMGADGWAMFMTLYNEGPTVAHDVRVLIDPPLRSHDGSPSLQPVQDRLAAGLKSLPPGRRMRWVLGSGVRILEEVPGSTNDLVHHITITGEGPYGPLSPLTYVLDLSEWRHTLVERDGSLHQVSEALKLVAKEVKGLKR